MFNFLSSRIGPNELFVPIVVHFAYPSIPNGDSVCAKNLHYMLYDIVFEYLFVILEIKAFQVIL